MSVDTTKPNDPVEDYLRIRETLGSLLASTRFDGVSVGNDGVIAKGGSLNWAGRNFGSMLTEDFKLPSLVGNAAAHKTICELRRCRKTL